MEQFADILPRIINILIDDLLVPALLILVPIILIKVQGYAKRMLTSTTDKNEKESLDAITNIMTNLTEQVKLIVGAAVAANMKEAEEFKSDETPVLTDEEIELLNDSARDMVYEMLPSTITDGSLLVLLGGQAGLDTLIDSLMEKELIEIKKK